MAKQILLSFKDNEAEIYNYLKSKSSPSAFIKDLVREHMNMSKQNKDKNSKQINNVTSLRNLIK